ncbi:hyalin-like isoform X2 [Amphiura filiformis]|uniref:hyalin-like isoform X2 n=1 Tax=Amphiura filiformis TaxID=82378 RepID=UPI003B222725
MELTHNKMVLPWSVITIIMVVSSYHAYAQPGLDRRSNITNCPQRDLYYVTDNDFIHLDISAPRITDAWRLRPGSWPITVVRMVGIPPDFYIESGNALYVPIGLSRTVIYTFTDSVGYVEQCLFTIHAIDWVYCQNDMCQNGATCIRDGPINAESICICPRGYYGLSCENVDQEPPAIVANSCPNNTIGFAPEDGTGSYLVSWREPIATDETDITIDKNHEPFTSFQPGITDVVYTFTDVAGNRATCSFTVQIYEGYWILYDGEAPEIYHCPSDNVIIRIPPGQTQTVVGWTEPWAKDKSGKLPTKNNNIGPMSMFPIGRTRVEYVFTDDQQNSATCAFDIIVITDENPIEIIENDWEIINCPASTIMANIPPNENSVMVMWNEPTAVSRSGRQTISSSKNYSPMSGFPVGGTEVIYQFTASDGTQDECRFTIFISQGLDNPPPPIIAVPEEAPVVVGCPTNIQATLPSGTTEVIVDWKEPQAHSPVNKPITITKTHQPSSVFLVTTFYTVRYVFTDSDGLSNTCSFDIFLSLGPMNPTIPFDDKIPPRIYDCPQDIAAPTPDATRMASIIWVEPYATDNSGVTPKVNKTYNPLDRFDLGQTTVTYTFTDLSSNKATCTFTITITESLCEHNGLSYSSRQVTEPNSCSQCACFTGIWYCRKLCSEQCPLIYPKDSGICDAAGDLFLLVHHVIMISIVLALVPHAVHMFVMEENTA